MTLHQVWTHHPRTRGFTLPGLGRAGTNCSQVRVLTPPTASSFPRRCRCSCQLAASLGATAGGISWVCFYAANC